MTDYPTKTYNDVWVCALVIPDAEFPTVPDAFLADTDFEPLKQTDPMGFDEKAATIPVAMEFVNRGPGLWSFVGTVIAHEIPNLGTEWRLGEGSFTRVTRDQIKPDVSDATEAYVISLRNHEDTFVILVTDEVSRWLDGESEMPEELRLVQDMAKKKWPNAAYGVATDWSARAQECYLLKETADDLDAELPSVHQFDSVPEAVEFARSNGMVVVDQFEGHWY